MSRYTTGEVAKLCGVTVRTVQYYDARGILLPSELSEGGRRLYTDDDVRRMRIICFLRELGLSLDAISQLLSEEDPGSVIELLVEQQELLLRRELEERQERLGKLTALRKELRSVEHFSVDSIGDIARLMESRKKLRQVHMTMLFTGIPLSVFQWSSILLWIFRGVWWPFLLYCLIAVPYALWVSHYYFRRVAYICPQCHEVFSPALKEAFWARHTPSARRLTCPNCGRHGFCVEIYGGEEKQ